MVIVYETMGRPRNHEMKEKWNEVSLNRDNNWVSPFAGVLYHGWRKNRGGMNGHDKD